MSMPRESHSLKRSTGFPPGTPVLASDYIKHELVTDYMKKEEIRKELAATTKDTFVLKNLALDPDEGVSKVAFGNKNFNLQLVHEVLENKLCGINHLYLLNNFHGRISSFPFDRFLNKMWSFSSKDYKDNEFSKRLVNELLFNDELSSKNIEKLYSLYKRFVLFSKDTNLTTLMLLHPNTSHEIQMKLWDKNETLFKENFYIRKQDYWKNFSDTIQVEIFAVDVDLIIEPLETLTAEEWRHKMTQFLISKGYSLEMQTVPLSWLEELVRTECAND